MQFIDILPNPWCYGKSVYQHLLRAPYARVLKSEFNCCRHKALPRDSIYVKISSSSRNRCVLVSSVTQQRIIQLH